MPALHIRDVEEKLVQRLKAEAALGGVTLREYVIGRLGGGKVGDRPAEDVPRDKKVPPAKRSTPEPEPVSAHGWICEHNCAANQCPYVTCKNFKRRM